MLSIDFTGFDEDWLLWFVGAYLTIVLCYTIEFTYDYFNGYIKVLGVYMGICLYRGGNEFKFIKKGGSVEGYDGVY